MDPQTCWNEIVELMAVGHATGKLNDVERTTLISKLYVMKHWDSERWILP